MSVLDDRLRPHPTAARVVTAIGPAHGAIAPGIARAQSELAEFATRFDESVEVYSPDPGEAIALLAPFLAEGHVVLMFALDGNQHTDAELVIDASTVSARLAGDHGPDLVRPARDVRHLVAFAVAEADLPAAATLR